MSQGGMGGFTATQIENHGHITTEYGRQAAALAAQHAGNPEALQAALKALHEDFFPNFDPNSKEKEIHEA